MCLTNAMANTGRPHHELPELPLDLVEAYRRHGDPLADETITAVFEHGGIGAVAKLLNEIIDRDELLADDDEHQHQYGPGYARFLDQSLLAPEGYDAKKMAASVKWFETYGWTAFSIFGCASLPEGYAVAEVSEVLSTTQALDDHTQRRLWETIQYVLDVMEPAGLTLDPRDPTRMTGIAAKRTQKVRLFHATIRFLLQYDSSRANVLDEQDAEPVPYGRHLVEYRWDEPRFGTPINQAQMSGTIYSFSWVVLRGLFTLGYRPDISDEMADAFLYRWNVAGHLMGVAPELLVEGADRAEALWNHLRRPDLTPGGRQLMVSLMDFMESQVPWLLFFLRPTARMLVVFLVGEEHARQVGLELTLTQKAWFVPMKLMMKLWSKVYGHSTAMQGITRWLYRTMRRNMLNKGRSGPRVFEVPESAPADRAWIRGS